MDLAMKSRDEQRQNKGPPPGANDFLCTSHHCYSCTQTNLTLLYEQNIINSDLDYM